jgi:hypothetical protein
VDFPPCQFRVAQNASAVPMESTNRLKCSFAAHFCDVAKVEWTAFE